MEAKHLVWICAGDLARLVDGQVTAASLAIDQHAFRGTLLGGELTLVQAFSSAVGVRPGSITASIWTPQHVSAVSPISLDVVGPHREYDRAIRANGAPTPSRVAQLRTAHLERLAPRNERAPIEFVLSRGLSWL
jgi:hypothetical protein